MLKKLNPNYAIVLSTLLWGTWWYPLRLLNEYANNNAIPLTLSFLSLIHISEPTRPY